MSIDRPKPEDAQKDGPHAPDAPAGVANEVQVACRFEIGSHLIVGALQNGMQSRFMPGSGMRILAVDAERQVLAVTDGVANMTVPWSCIEQKPNALPRITVRLDAVVPPVAAGNEPVHSEFPPGTEALVTSERTDSPLFTKGSVVIVFGYDPSRTDGRTLRAEWNGVTDWINPKHLTPCKPESQAE